MTLTKQQYIDLKALLNKKYDMILEIDKEIDFLILKRNHLYSEVESGAAILLKYSPYEEEF